MARIIRLKNQMSHLKNIVNKVLILKNGMSKKFLVSREKDSNEILKNNIRLNSFYNKNVL
jgi:hypothetical protein